MRNLNLTIEERIKTPFLLNEIYQKGGLSLGMLSDAQNILRKLTIEREFNSEPEKPKKGESLYPKIYKVKSGEEAKKANMRLEVIVTRNEQGMVQEVSSVRWDTEKDEGKEIEFSEDEIKLLAELIKNKDEKKELKLEDGYLVKLNEKLEKAEKK